MKRIVIICLHIIFCFVFLSAAVVTRTDVPSVKCGLDGRIIAVWPSHGAYYNAGEARWKWQRGRIFGTVEDLYTQSYVIPFLIPMLENAGAYVVTPRERDISSEEIIIDNDGHHAHSRPTFHSSWHHDKSLKGFAYTSLTLQHGENPFENGTVMTAKTVRNESSAAVAQWNAFVPADGEYAVYVSYATAPQSAPDALYRVNSESGAAEFRVDQRCGGGTWMYLGTFPFRKGKSEKPLVELVAVSSSPGSVVTADAVKIGGGMGNVARGGEVSGMPRRCEGARYWLQWAGMPDSVYSATSGADDYVDDYKSRGLWVNYLTGGSGKNPGAQGLNIPVDLSLAFHTDAGITDDNSTVGTLAIVSHGKNTRYGNGELTSTADDYARMVSDQIVNDIRALYNPDWTQRPMRNRQYHEASSPVVPAMILELLSHQNFTDMTYGLDPGFRFAVSRAVYKGILRYLSAKSGEKYVVQPLPVNSFAISGSSGDYMLSWKPTVDSLESSATPAAYIVEQRKGNGVFTTLTTVDDPWLKVEVESDEIMSYRVIAVNDGGRSFPSEVLSLCRKGDESQQMLIVNGFTRLSGPDMIAMAGCMAGMDYASDHGVPFGCDLAFTGEQTDFNPRSEWKSDDNPGFGASRGDFERKVFYGNTFDNVREHGKAISAAGMPFISASLDGFLSSMPSSPYLDLILGKQKLTVVGAGGTVSARECFTPEVMMALTKYCETGGNLIVSGSYIASDATPEVSRWMRELLGVGLCAPKATVTGEVRSVKSRYDSFSDLKLCFNQSIGEEPYACESPDAILPSGQGGAVVMRYGENGLPAVVAVEKPEYKAVVAGFPLETVTENDALTQLFRSSVAFFKAQRKPAEVKKSPEPSKAKKVVPKKKTKKSKSRKK